MPEDSWGLLWCGRLPITAPFRVGPGVRIPFAPAASLQTFGPSRDERLHPFTGHVRQAGGDSGVELSGHNGRRRQWKRWSAAGAAAGARSTAWRIVLRPQRRYQALRLRRTAADGRVCGH
jgi:hypothetical protein